jgi:hypothetical protein
MLTFNGDPRVNQFGEKAGAIMRELDSYCKELGINAKKSFGFSWLEEESRYCLFIDYEALVSELDKNASNGTTRLLPAI